MSDAYAHVIRKIDVSTGFISTFVGTGVAAYGGDGGPATAAQLNDPNGICFDKWGNLYVADYMNARIRKINTSGIISTVAGTGINGYNGDGGLADTSMIRGALDVCTDTIGNLYIADEANMRIRKVDLAGIIYTYAGSGGAAYTGDGGPATAAEITPHLIASDSYGNIYFADIYTDRARRINSLGIIHTIAGTTSGFGGDGGPATAAQFNNIGDLTSDSCGNLYVGDVANQRFRKITFNTSCNPTLETKQTKPTIKISLYPNPAATALTISAAGEVKEVSVWDVFGRELTTPPSAPLLMVRQPLTTGGEFLVRVDVSDLPAGVYMVRVVDEDGGVVVRRFVKE